MILMPCGLIRWLVMLKVITEVLRVSVGALHQGRVSGGTMKFKIQVLHKGHAIKFENK